MQEDELDDASLNLLLENNPGLAELVDQTLEGNVLLEWAGVREEDRPWIHQPPLPLASQWPQAPQVSQVPQIQSGIMDGSQDNPAGQGTVSSGTEEYEDGWESTLNDSSESQKFVPSNSGPAGGEHTQIVPGSEHSARTPGRSKINEDGGNPRWAYYCTYNNCDMICNNFGAWKSHDKVHWPKKTFICLHCSLPKEGFKCQFCKLQAVGRRSLELHVLQCGNAHKKSVYVFDKIGTLKRHLRKFHPDAPEEEEDWVFEPPVVSPRYCRFCDFVLETWEHRAVHLQDHFQDGLTKSDWNIDLHHPNKDS